MRPCEALGCGEETYAHTQRALTTISFLALSLLCVGHANGNEEGGRRTSSTQIHTNTLHTYSRHVSHVHRQRGFSSNDNNSSSNKTTRSWCLRQRERGGKGGGTRG